MRDRRFGKEEESLGPVLVGVGALSPSRAVWPLDRVNVKIVVRPMTELPFEEAGAPAKKYPTSAGTISRNAYGILHAALVDLGSVHPGVVYEYVEEYVDGKFMKKRVLNDRAALVSVLSRVGMPPLSVSNTLPRPSPTRTAALSGTPDGEEAPVEEAPPEEPKPEEAAPAQVVEEAPAPEPGDLGATPEPGDVGALRLTGSMQTREMIWNGATPLHLTLSPEGDLLVTVDRPGGATYRVGVELRLMHRRGKSWDVFTTG